MTRQFAVIAFLLTSLWAIPSHTMPLIYYPTNAEEIEASLRETGKRRMCLRFTDIKAVIPLRSDRAIFVDSKDIAYVNNFISGCRGLLDPEGMLQFQLSSGNFCRNGRLYVFARTATAPSGSCAVGDYKQLLTPGLPVAPLRDPAPVE